MKRCLTISAIALVTAVCAFAAAFPNPPVDETAPASNRESAVLAGGCFWGMEAVFSHVKGVKGVVSGYSGDTAKTARSELVEAGKTRHAESVKITYDPSKITYGQILKLFFSIAHDPTQLNRQGPDVGTQYRSIIFYANDEQKKIAEAYMKELAAAHIYPSPIVTELVQFEGFYPAEAFLQHYSERNPHDPYVVHNDLPKLAALKRNFPEVYK